MANKFIASDVLFKKKNQIKLNEFEVKIKTKICKSLGTKVFKKKNKNE